jgi:hypothetical protein
MNDVRDLRHTIIPKSDQLNSEQLLGGSIIVTITDVRAGGGADQPLSVHYEGENGRPYKPCKTMRKVLIHAWGSDGTQWPGRSLELYNEPSIKFGGETVGGIRISRMTDIPEKGIRVSLTATRGKKALHEIKLLRLGSVETPSADFSDAHTIAIQTAETLEALKEAFTAAQTEARAAKDAGRLSRYVQLKEERKGQLEKPTADSTNKASE